MRSVPAFTARLQTMALKESSEWLCLASCILFNDSHRKRDALWAEFQASLSTPQPRAPDAGTSRPRLVMIEKRYRFAGEEVV